MYGVFGLFEIIVGDGEGEEEDSVIEEVSEEVVEFEILFQSQGFKDFCNQVNL